MIESETTRLPSMLIEFDNPRELTDKEKAMVEELVNLNSYHLKKEQEYLANKHWIIKSMNEIRDKILKLNKFTEIKK